MKLYKAIRFLMLSGILTLVLSRCIRESLEGCPLDTLLRFTYKPRGSAADLFGERVQRVRLCVYRPDGSIEHMQTLEKSELDRLQGVEMYLPQGNYTVVLWANASDAQTKLGGFSEGETIRNLSASHRMRRLPLPSPRLIGFFSLSRHLRSVSTRLETILSISAPALSV